MPTISIIAIFYNSAAYVDKCLGSILAQQGVDFELITVDDASPTDNTLEKLEEYAARDERVRVIRHDENRGISAARNTGMAAARGEWFLLIDGDDWLETGALQTLYKNCSPEVDWVQGSYRFVDEQGEQVLLKQFVNSHFTTREQIVAGYEQSEFKLVHNCLINRRLIDIQFWDGAVWEDLIWKHCAYYRVCNIVTISDITYNYLVRRSSLSNSKQVFSPAGVIWGSRFVDMLFKRGLDVNLRKVVANRVPRLLRDLYVCDFTAQFRRETRLRLGAAIDMHEDLATLPPFTRAIYRMRHLPDFAIRIFALCYKKWRKSAL